MLDRPGDDAGSRSSAFALVRRRRRGVRNNAHFRLERSVDSGDEATGKSQFEAEGVPQSEYLSADAKRRGRFGSFDRPELREEVVGAL